MNNNELEFLWIVSPSSKIYVQRVFDRNLNQIDEAMFSNLLTSLSMFSTTMFDAQFQEINIGEKLVFIKSYPEFQVVLSAKKSLKDRTVCDSLEEVGEAFCIQYSDSLQNLTKMESCDFCNFGSIIDMIFGIETFMYLEEQDMLLKILEKAIDEGYNESHTLRVILDFLDNLDDFKLDVLISNVGENIKDIMTNVKGLSETQQKRYKKIIG